ncbi:MAG: DNA polymerase IV [Nannocystaceae bacterium]|nr:DNA polymerase IV [Nannocystaceae bacterium]
MTGSRAILHVDMDAFFASVEIRDDPSLRGKPVLVGGVGRRGVIAAASYEARKFGCHSAQPTAIALRKCPHAVVLPSRIGAYSEASSQVFEVFDRFSPLVEALSIDEAFIDVSGTEKLFGPPRACAESIRAAVFEATKLTCSVGISSVKFIAKIASAANKPDGLTEVHPGTEVSFLGPLPIGKLWGVGPKAEEHLRARGITTVGELSKHPEKVLRAWFGQHGSQLYRLSHAMDDRGVTPGSQRKSVSHEDTYEVDVVGAVALKRKLVSQATRVADRLVAKGFRGRLVRLKIRDGSFNTESRQCVLPKATREAKVIYQAACGLLDKVDLSNRGFRLTGIGVGQLERQDAKGTQLDLLAAVIPESGDALQSVMSEVRRRYGHEALFPADAGSEARAGSAGGFTKSYERDE